MGRRADSGSTATELPADIHADLVQTLFGTVGSFASGIIGGLLVPAVIWFRTGGIEFGVCAASLLLFTVLRVALFVAHRRAGPRDRFARAAWWEAAYGVGGIGFMSCVGILSALTLDGRYDELTALYGALSMMGCAGSLAGRNAGRPRIVLGQLLGLCGPSIVVFLLRWDPWSWGLSFILVLVVTSVGSTTRFLNGMLVSALLSDRESRQQRLKLSVALDSMTHGLCMAGPDGSITVLNRRLRDFFGLSDRDPPATLGALAEGIGIFGAMSVDDAALFARGFRAHVDGREPRHWTEAIGPRIFLFRSQPMEQGGSVIVVEDVTEARRSAQKVEYLAHFDSLTGLVNRFQFHQDLCAALSAPPGEGGVALLSVDLDRFKEVNDTLGHPAGDKLLRQVADRLRALAGPTSTVSRFGGDEFQIMTRPCPPDPALDLFARGVIARLSEPYTVDGHNISIGATIGLAVAPSDAAEGDDLLKCVDMALYGAKAISRGTFLRFVPEMDAVLQRKRRIELELRQAMDEGQIEVFYQPAVDIRTGRVTTCEALARWRHPVRGLVPPDDFIPIAEESGLIADLGEIVLRRACEDALAWPEDVRVAVNVSPKQFLLRQDLVERVQRTLDATGLPPGRLEIEITESTLLDAKAALSTLAERGIRISLDDFGTGYSSLSYLRMFTIHKIKIDRSFVKIADRASLAIIEAVAFLADAIDVDLVVEGVENQEQLKLMADRHIHLVQGYLFSKPRTVEELSPLLKGTIEIAMPILQAVA